MANSNEKTSNKRTESKSTESAMARRSRRRNGRGSSEGTDWESANPEYVLKLIATVALLGGTTTFGYTRDKGAYYISYFIDGESDRVYIRPTEDIDQSLLGEIETWE